MCDATSRVESNVLAALTQFDLHARLGGTTGVTLLAFTGAACGSCRHLRRVLLALHELRPNWQLFEVDAEREAGLVNEFEVFHLPTVFLYHDGQFHCPLTAEADPAAIIRAVDAALQQPAQEAP